jgi:hypothetical protein
MRVPAPRWRLFVLTVVGCLAVAVGGFVTSTATAVSPTAPVKMILTSISSGVTAPTGTPTGAVPRVLVQASGTATTPPANSLFTVQVNFYDALGNPASFSKDTALSISTPSGTLTTSTGVAPAGADHATITTSLATPANQVSLTVVAGSKKTGLTASSSDGTAAFTFIDGSQIPDQRFDVLSELHEPTPVGAGGTTAIGGDDDSCTNATSTRPVCGILSLPLGASSDVVMSLGACDATYAACGSNKGAVVQALADLGPGYTLTSPATLIVKCDKALCGGGAIQNVHLEFSLLGNDSLHQAESCPAKNTLGAGQDACVDYVQSKRDGSGDTYLYLLFDQDMRTSVG